MEFRGYTVRPHAHTNPLVSHTCYVRSFVPLRMGPWRCPTDFAAQRWHRHPVSRKAATRMARNPKGVSQREVNLKEAIQKVTTQKAMSQRATTQKAASQMAVSQRAKIQKVVSQRAEMSYRQPRRSTVGSSAD